MDYRIYMMVRFQHGALAECIESLRPYWDRVTAVDCTDGRGLQLPVETLRCPDFDDSISKMGNWCFDNVIARNLDAFFCLCSDVAVLPGVIEDMLANTADIYAKRGWLLRIKTDVIRKVRFDEKFWFYCSDTDWRRRVVQAGFTIKEDCGWDNVPAQNLLSDATNVVRTGQCCPHAQQKCGVLHLGVERKAQTIDWLSPRQKIRFNKRKDADYAYYKQKWGKL